MKIDVTGLSINDIMGMDWVVINKLSEKDLRALSSRLNSAANKRLKRIEKSGVEKYSPAYAHVMEKGKFSTKGKDANALKNEIQRATGFLLSKTGSVSGARAHRERIREILTGVPKGKETTSPSAYDPQLDTMTKAQKKKLYGALNRLREKQAAKVHDVGSEVIIRELRRIQLKDMRMSADNIIKQLEEKYPELMEESEAKYEREQKEYKERTDEDGIFRALNADESSHNPFKT